MILAPLRGVTIRAFREVFAACIAEAGFTEAITPFIPAMPGYDPLHDRELLNSPTNVPLHLISSPFFSTSSPFRITPQFIGKDPAALRECLLKVKAAGFTTADLNCGCPYPMVRNKGRGSGLLQHPETFERMLAAGCEAMGDGQFSIKVRLGVERNDELLKSMPIINRYPLRFMTVHGRIAKQMYDGEVDWTMVGEISKQSKVPLVLNGDLSLLTLQKRGRGVLTASEKDDHLFDAVRTPRPRSASRRSSTLQNNHQCPPPPNFSTFSPTHHCPPPPNFSTFSLMIGRSFIRSLGERADIGKLLSRYIDYSQAELHGDRPVLGRLKELIAYWKDSPRWHRRWQVVKLSRTVEELRQALGITSC